MRTASSGRRRLLALVAIILVPVGIQFAIVATASIPLALRWSPWVLAKFALVSATAIMQWTIYVGLLITFGLTLRKGHEPLITGMVRRMHGGLDLALIQYTRKVTVAWTLFFAAQIIVSISLLCFAPLVVWSFYVNILDIPLVLTMFAIEYVVRQRCLENPPHHSLAAILAMISEPMQKETPASSTTESL